jgi:hypothetical protein
MNVVNDEIPESIARVVGHVCGVIAVVMAGLSLAGLWALVHRYTWGGLIAVTVAVGLATLFFRWAGALTGYWDTSGRLSVPKTVYVVFAAFVGVCAATSGYLLFVDMPTSFDKALTLLIGVICAVPLIYLCYLATQRFR